MAFWLRSVSFSQVTAGLINRFFTTVNFGNDEKYHGNAGKGFRELSPSLNVNFAKMILPSKMKTMNLGISMALLTLPQVMTKLILIALLTSTCESTSNLF